MQNIEPGEGTANRTDLLHRGLIAPPPCVGEGGRIGARRITGEESGRFPRHSAAPVYDRAKDIENERLKVGEGRHGAARRLLQAILDLVDPGASAGVVQLAAGSAVPLPIAPMNSSPSLIGTPPPKNITCGSLARGQN